MAKEIYSSLSDPFFMTGEECAQFACKYQGKIASRLRGKKEDVADAIAEVICKCIGAKLGSGSVLKWKDNPFETARTEEQWIALLVYQCRTRLNVIRSIRKYWFDSDVIRQFKTVDDVDGILPADHAAIEAGTHEGVDDPDEGSEVDEKLYRQRKIVEYLAAEADRMHGNHYPVPGKSYEDDVNYKAAYAVLADMVKSRSVSRRDLEIWVNCIMYRRDRSEVAREFGVKPNHLDQIVHRVKEILRIVGPRLHRTHALGLFHEAA